MKTVRWAVLGLGKTTDRFLNGLAQSPYGVLAAAASRTKAKRDAFQNEHPDALIYEDYDAMLSNPQLDAVYITLRHPDHHKWAKAALLKDKAVLVEKPATLSVKETQELTELAQTRGIFFLEALKTRFLPLSREVRYLAEKGIIGDIVSVTNSFCYDLPYNPDSYLFLRDQGGILNDVGTYTIGAITDLIRSPLKSLEVMTEWKYGVDAFDHVEFTFESGQTAVMEVALDRSRERSMRITGTRGIIDVLPFHRPEKVIVRPEGGSVYTLYDRTDDFLGEIEAVHSGIRDGRTEDPRMSHADSIRIIDFMERIRLAGQSSKHES